MKPSIDEIIHRNNTIRNYIRNRTWDNHPKGKIIEFNLVRDVEKNLSIRKPGLSKYQYIYDYEWDIVPGESHKGKGDLIFTNKMDSFLIVECKTKDSNFVRNQVRDRIEQFKKNNFQFENYLICGLAVSPQSWDYLNEIGEWEFEIDEKDENYLQLYTNLELEQKETKIKNKYQKTYKDLGYKPKDPISALNELIQAEILAGDLSKHPKGNHPPFLVKLKFKLLKIFPEKIILGAGENLNFTIAKGLAAINICEKIYLSYNLKSWDIPVDKIDRSDVYRIK